MLVKFCGEEHQIDHLQAQGAIGANLKGIVKHDILANRLHEENLHCET